MNDEDPELRCRSSDPSQQEAEEALEVLIQSAKPRTFGSRFSARVLQSIREERDLSALIKTRAPNRFSAPLEGRVLATLRGHNGRSAAPGIADALSQLFPWITAPAGALTVLALALNVAAASPGAPLLDALLGLQSADGLDIGLLVPTRS